MKKLTDSAIFTKLGSNQSVMSNVRSINITRDKIPMETYQNEISTIQRRINYPTKGKVMYNLMNERIILINNPSIKLPKYLNIVGTQSNNKGIVMTVAINSYTNSSGEIFPKTLFGLLQNATISLELFENWNRFTMHIEFLKNAAQSYSRLMGKVFDKLFAINIDDFKSDLVHFYLSKFFLVNVCGKNDSDTVNNIAYASCYNRSNYSLITDQEDTFNGKQYDNIFELFNNLKTVPGLEGLNIRGFIENWVRMYGESTLLAMDYLPAFLNMIFASIVGGNLNKEYIIDSVAGKTNNKAFMEFSKLIK